MTACRACRTPMSQADVLDVPEMMFGTGERFDYGRCPACGSLSLLEIPADMAPYYPADYYSLNVADSATRSPGLAGVAKRARTELYLRRDPATAERLVRDGKAQPFVGWLAGTGLTTRSSILDVGSGGGEILSVMHAQGFTDLLGIDPFLPEPEQTTPGGITLRRARPEELAETFDLVMMNHAFEHVLDPPATLRALRERLTADGRVLIRVPVADSDAFERYGVDWVQLDAPRHVLVPTVKGMESLAEQTGLLLERVFHDSYSLQFWGSEQYRMGIPLRAPNSAAGDDGPFTDEQLAAWETEAERVNAAGRGDQAGFVLRAA